MRATNLLLERDGEFTTIAAAIGAARKGAGGVVVVEGRAGVGKSRLLEAAREEALAEDMRVLWARSNQVETEFAYGVVRQLFEPVLRAAGPGALFTGTAAQAAPIFDLSDDSAGDSSFASLHGLYWLTADLAQDQPLLIAVDDLQWADTPSMLYIRHLVPRLAELPVVVVAGVRTGTPATQPGVLDSITSADETVVVAVDGLSEAASCVLVAAVTGAEPAPSTCRAIYEIARGNPLLTRELAREARQDKASSADVSADDFTMIAARVIGGRVRRQLRDVPADMRQLVTMLSALGGGELPVAARMAELDLPTARKHAGQLVDMGILQRAEPAQFAHPLIQSSIYEDLSTTDRANAHARAASVLNRMGAGADKVAPHLLRASTVDELDSITVLQRAARHAERAGSSAAAVTYLERILLDVHDESIRRRTLIDLGRLTMANDLDRARGYLEATAPGAASLELATIADLLSNIRLFQGQLDDALEVRLSALRALGDSEPDLAQRLAAGIGNCYMFDEAADAFTNHAESWRSIEPAHGQGGRLLDAFLAVHDTCQGINRSDVFARATRALNATGESKIPIEHVGWANASLAMECADPRMSLHYARQGIVEAYRTGSGAAVSQARIGVGVTSDYLGDLDTAESSFREGYDVTFEVGLQLNHPAAAMFARVLIERGKFQEADAYLDRISPGETVPSSGVWFWYLAARAEAAYARQDWSSAIALMRACGASCARHGFRNPALIAWRSGLALALLKTGEVEEAEALLVEEVELARTWGEARPIGRALRRLAKAASGPAEIELLRESLAVLEDSGAELEYAKSAAELGIAMAHGGFRAEGTALLTSARAKAVTCGCDPLAERVLHEMHRLGMRPRRAAAHGFDALTPGERRVVELARGGQTNREIAQELFVTTKTIEKHLAAAYRKMQITGRAQLAE